jgi:hypothetical protein
MRGFIRFQVFSYMIDLSVVLLDVIYCARRPIAVAEAVTVTVILPVLATSVVVIVVMLRRKELPDIQGNLPP